MTAGQPRYPKEEFARRGDEIYEVLSVSVMSNLG